MHVLHLFLEGLLALSAVSFCICACFIDDRDNDTPLGRTQKVTSTTPACISATFCPVPMP
jgi:hypothetical protein